MAAARVDERFRFRIAGAGSERERRSFAMPFQVPVADVDVTRFVAA